MGGFHEDRISGLNELRKGLKESVESRDREDFAAAASLKGSLGHVTAPLADADQKINRVLGGVRADACVKLQLVFAQLKHIAKDRNPFCPLHP